MEFTKELKEKLKGAKSKDEAKEIIEKAGFILSDEEMESISGGYDWAKAEREAIKFIEDTIFVVTKGPHLDPPPMN